MSRGCSCVPLVDNQLKIFIFNDIKLNIVGGFQRCKSINSWQVVFFCRHCFSTKISFFLSDLIVKMKKGFILETYLYGLTPFKFYWKLGCFLLFL